MITEDTLRGLLTYLKFQDKSNIFSKRIGEAILKIDFEKRK